MDRQDIDALLIGALYGELTPADEARLALHLDSHPTDRGALDDLKSARQAVRESRIFELQLEPPQALSALLLQEAHRRAPKRAASRDDKAEGWFFRFTRVFLAHPAMAAAAMLVLVVGFAGMLYMKKGSEQFAKTEVAPPAIQTNEQPALVAPADPSANEGSAQLGLGEGAHGTDGSGYRVDLDDNKAPRDEASVDKFSSDRGQAEQVARFKAQQQALERRDAEKNKKSAIVVDTPRPQPKELDEPRAKTATKSATSKAPAKGGEDFGGYDSEIVVGGATTGTASGGGSAPAGRTATTTPPAAGPSRNAPTQPSPAPAPPPPAANAAPAPATVAQGTAKPTAPAKQTVAKEAEKAEAKPDAAKDTSLIAWAKDEHSRAVALASKGDCTTAAKVAVTISNRAPAYYSQFVSTDRALKKCQAYIAAERDADAERANKTRAQKRATATDTK